MSKLRCPALIVSSIASGQGKTTFTAALAYKYRKEGKRVSVFKAGPDYIDPTFHEFASANDVYNLDLWMMGEEECRQLLSRAASQSDLLLIEGVMGLFDGSPSTADLARRFDIPVVTVVNASSMAETFAAVLSGLVNFDKTINMIGVIANAVASDRHEEMICRLLPTNVSYLGSIGRVPSGIRSRHLGLEQAFELPNLEDLLDRTLASFKLGDFSFPEVEFPQIEPVATTLLLDGLRISVAKDSAFSFLYRRNLEFLESSGAKISYFSPLEDNQIPASDLVYLPGGYPELHGDSLSRNSRIKSSFYKHLASGGRIYAECGGMLYLLDEIELPDSKKYSMLGLLKGRAVLGTRLKSIGYQYMRTEFGKEIRGHTFHYTSSTVEENPAGHFLLKHNNEFGEPYYRQDQIFASYMHLYFPSNPHAIAGILRRDCRNTLSRQILGQSKSETQEAFS